MSQIFQDPSKVEQVIATVGLSDFTNATAAKTLAAMRRLVDAGGSVTLAAVGDELNRVGDLGSIGGPVALAEIFDLEASAVGLLDAARGVRLRSLRRRERLLHVQASQGDRIENARDELLKVEGELAALEGGAQADLPDLTFSGSRLESVRDRDEPTSPLPGLFDPEPGLHVFVGQSSQGKTTLALHVGQSWSCGVEPWEGAPRLPGSPVLFISREQSVRRIDRRARVLDTQNSRITRQAWTDRLLIVARDRDLPRALCPLLRLDEKGLPLLRQLLQQAKDDGDPIGLVVLDSLSRLKPAGMSESDNDDMADWLDELHGMSEETDAYFLLIHHKGHVERDGDRGAGRGASAIDAVAQATWDLRRVPGEQAFRELRVYGNGVDDSTRTFRVAPDCDPGKVMFWRLEGPDDAMKPEDHLTPGEAITTEDLAWKLSGKIRSATGSNGRRARAPRDAQIRAAAARDRWEAEGRISISTGLHNAKLITLATENLEPEAQKNAVAF
ncbi:MAG: AAA family ATPase [Myxococcales bacterium]|nr:AAA family ATPase [Myxococcales bacterium]